MNKSNLNLTLIKKFSLLDCACVHHDAKMCTRIRDNIPPDKWDIEDEFCKCLCHDRYEDEEDF